MVMAEESYLIWYDGERSLLETYCGKLQKLGFVKEETMRLESLDLLMVRCRFEGNDAAEGVRLAQSLDDRIRIEVNKSYYPAEKP
jgi:hypothetical protein